MEKQSKQEASVLFVVNVFCVLIAIVHLFEALAKIKTIGLESSVNYFINSTLNSIIPLYGILLILGALLFLIGIIRMAFDAISDKFN